MRRQAKAARSRARMSRCAGGRRAWLLRAASAGRQHRSALPEKHHAIRLQHEEKMSAARSFMPSLARAVKRPQTANLAPILQEQMKAIRDRTYVPVGYALRIQLGACDDSAYFQDPVNAQIAPLTRIHGLAFEWDQTCYPQMTEMHARGSGSFLFP